MVVLQLGDGVADSFAPGQGHEPAGEWVGGPHDGMGPECLAERAANAPRSGSNHKRIMVGLRFMPRKAICLEIWALICMTCGIATSDNLRLHLQVSHVTPVFALRSKRKVLP